MKLIKVGLKAVNQIVGIAGIAVAAVYWFDLDDKIVAYAVPKMKAKAEKYAAEQAAQKA